MSALPFGIRRVGRPYVARADVSLIGVEIDALMRGHINEGVARRHHEAKRKSSTTRDRILRSARMRHVEFGHHLPLGAVGAAYLFDKGRDGFNTKALSWTGDTQKAILIDATASTGNSLKLITNVTNANPAVYTSATHGFSNNDVLVCGGITSSAGIQSANQTGLAASVATNTFDLNTLEGLAVQTSGAYASGGYAVDLTLAQFVVDILGTRIGTDPTVSGTTSSRGVANATSPVTWTTVPAGNPGQFICFYDAAGGSDSTNKLIAFQDGKVRVVVDKAVVATDTVIYVEPLKAQLWDGSTGGAPVFHWSDGHASTLNAAANQGDRSITITSQAAGGVAVGSTADMSDFGGGLPVTPSGGNISFNVGSIYAPTTPTGIYKL
jgi:hypothetical protein